MDVYLDDEGFVRAPAVLVYRRLADPSSYGDWWPAFRLRSAAPVGTSWEAEAQAAPPPAPGEFEGRPATPGEARLSFTLRARWWMPTIALEARPYRFRPGKGAFLDVRGTLNGTFEWWLEEGHGGTTVHHLARCDIAARGRGRVARAYRLALREGLWGLKDAVQSEVRELVDLPP